MPRSIYIFNILAGGVLNLICFLWMFVQGGALSGMDNYPILLYLSVLAGGAVSTALLYPFAFKAIFNFMNKRELKSTSNLVLTYIMYGPVTFFLANGIALLAMLAFHFVLTKFTLIPMTFSEIAFFYFFYIIAFKIFLFVGFLSVAANQLFIKIARYYEIPS